MKEEVKNEWVKRLRSGEITQGRQILGNINGERCCLGVLCDIAVENDVIPAPTTSSSFPSKSRTLMYHNVSMLLPIDVRSFAEMLSDDGEISFQIEDYNMSSLATLNDDGFTFDQIADLIEYFWRDL